MTDTERHWGHRRIEGGWEIATWAPTAERMTLEVDGTSRKMETQDGWHIARIEAVEGATYGFRRDGDTLLPAPASRAQSGGVHAPSKLIDISAIPRTEWSGRPWEETSILELHVGTFTEEGTLAAAARKLPDLASLGFTCVELMPLAQFDGDRGWGYDGVLPFAVHPAYGTPRDMVAFVSAAHEAGLMVLVDAVYNHFGPEGAVLSQLCPTFFDEQRHTPWGAAIDFDKPQVRSFFLQNAEMWLRDYGVDGLRLDAVHQIGREGDTDFLTELSERVIALDLDRPLHLVTEDERNLVSYVGRDALQAQWNDDYHHAVHCLLTGESQSYYAPFSDDPFGDMVTALRDGQVDQGQPRPNTEDRRGEPSSELPPICFVNANQTHDQIGNRAFGDRLIALAGPERMEVMHAMLCLAPFVPMLFMGEEIGSRAPFQFFTDFHGDLADAVRKGRRSEFPEFADAQDEIPDPNAPETFARSRPYADLPEDADDWRALTRACLALRKSHVVPLLKSGWRETRVERTGPGTLLATWVFEQGRLDLTFSTEGPAPAIPTTELFSHERPGAAMRMGIGGAE